MGKRLIFYIIGFILLVVNLFFFNKAYRALTAYSELSNRHNMVYSNYQALSRQVNNAAVLHPELTKASDYSIAGNLFFTDSQKVIQQLDLLRASVRDSVNIRITEKLDILIRPELSWLLRSNVPDSIINHKAASHIASFKSIDSLIAKGIQRTNFLIAYRDTQLHDEIREVRILIIAFVLLSGILLLYTTVHLFRQRYKTKRKEKELEIVFNRISDGVVSVDNNWRYTFLNDAALATHPSGKEGTLGKNIWEVHPEMKGTIFWDRYHEAMLTKKMTEIESFYAPMGMWFSVSVYPSDDGLTIFYKNITENKKLQEREALFASIVNSSDDGILSKTLDGIITSWNQGAEKIFGYSAKEIIGEHISILIPAKLRNEENEIMSKIRKGETIDHYETERIRKDGKIINVSLAISPIKGADGAIIGASKISRDISSQKEAEEKLAASEMHFRSLIENSADGITLADANSNTIYRSPASKKIMGALPTENTIMRTHPDDLETMKSLRNEILNNPGLPVPFQGRFLHADGHYTWLEGVLTNMLHVKEVHAIVTNFRDITQRKESEERIFKSEKIYKTIASSIPGSVICLLDTDYRYLLIEGDMLEKFGYSKIKLLGKKAADVLPIEIFEEVEKEFQSVLKGETIIRESRRQGYDAISRFIPLKDENNTVYSILIVTIDITELKDAHRDIAALNKDLEKKIALRTMELKKSNEELEAFSYSVSHDLRAPLRAILGFTGILEEDYASKLDEEARRITGTITQNTIRMGKLIDDLLTFSRTGKQELQKATIDTGEMVRGLINDLLFENKACAKIGWKTGPLIPMHADTSTIRQVWINLLSNAVKYSSTVERPCIEIGSYEEQDQMIFYIKDNGVGFDPAYKEKLFGVFQRLHDPEEFEGTGVGLALVDKIISRHGGKVWGEGEPGKGASFFFSLPVCHQQSL